MSLSEQSSSGANPTYAKLEEGFREPSPSNRQELVSKAKLDRPTLTYQLGAETRDNRVSAVGRAAGVPHSTQLGSGLGKPYLQ
jgi:hypothetical protein